MEIRKWFCFPVLFSKYDFLGFTDVLIFALIRTAKVHNAGLYREENKSVASETFLKFPRSNQLKYTENDLVSGIINTLGSHTQKLTF